MPRDPQQQRSHKIVLWYKLLDSVYFSETALKIKIKSHKFNESRENDCCWWSHSTFSTVSSNHNGENVLLMINSIRIPLELNYVRAKRTICDRFGGWLRVDWLDGAAADALRAFQFQWMNDDGVWKWRDDDTRERWATGKWGWTVFGWIVICFKRGKWACCGCRLYRRCSMNSLVLHWKCIYIYQSDQVRLCGSISFIYNYNLNIFKFLTILLPSHFYFDILVNTPGVEGPVVPEKVRLKHRSVPSGQ